MPELRWLRPTFDRRIALAVLALSLALVAAPMLIDPLPNAAQNLLAHFHLESDYLGAALRSYTLSPGASIWGTSPIVLLSLAGGALLWRQRQYRLGVDNLSDGRQLCVGTRLDYRRALVWRSQLAAALPSARNSSPDVGHGAGGETDSSAREIAACEFCGQCFCCMAYGFSLIALRLAGSILAKRFRLSRKGYPNGSPPCGSQPIFAGCCCRRDGRTWVLTSYGRERIFRYGASASAC